MAPKKKGNKNANDDWETEALGEVTASDRFGETETAANGREEPDADGPASGGALLAAIKRNRQNKKKKGKVDGVSDDGPSTNVDDEQTHSVSNTQTPDVDSDQVLNLLNAQVKAGKKVPTKHDTASSENGDRDEDNQAGLRTKKDKEKEKKEREKARKKEQATKKKSTPAPTLAPKIEVEKVSPDTTVAASQLTETGKTGKKKVPAALAAIQKQQELLRQEREAKEQADVEERARIAEEERQAAAEEKRREDARLRKKEKEKEKKERLKKEGKLLTPAQKEQQRRDEMKREQMIAAGMRVPGMDAESTERKKPVYDSKRRKLPQKQDSKTKADEDVLLASEENTQQQLKPETDINVAVPNNAQTDSQVENEAESENDGFDDWEEAADAEEEGIAPNERRAEAKGGNLNSSESHTSKVNGVNQETRPQAKDIEAHSEASSDESDTAATGTAAERAAAQRKADLTIRRKHEHEQALAARSKDNLRSPICCILGHVDTGKTKLLDKIRQTNVQEGEAGGITQQIGATYFPKDALQSKIEVVNKDGKFDFKVPGLLVIDTPGHESFTNLRSRGSSLCNIAILVVDIMHGLEPQTLESMRLLRDRKTPFIVALNKIDRLYGWKKIDNNGFVDSMVQQNKGVQNEFRDRLEKTKVAFAEQGFNAELFTENKSMARNVSLVPTSAHTGEGIPDILKLLVTLTQERMTSQLMYLSEVECTVLEVKVIEGLGTTIDVVLSNGVLREGDRIVLCGLNGAISTNIRALLTPAPLKELRLKSQYVHNQECKASLGVKIAANDLENAIAGSRLLVVRDPEEEEDLEDEVMSDIENLLSRVSKTGRGVSVQASTLGSLEALLEFLRVSKIPVANISIGPVYKRDVMSAGIMLEKAREYAVMLCFDVKVDREAQSYADEQGVKIFTADIIYHLFDDFTKHMAQLTEQKKEESKMLAVFPCVLQPIAVFMKKDPILVGADVIDGTLKVHTPIAAVKTNSITGVKETISLGRVTSIEREHKSIPLAKKGSPSVAVKIEGPNQPLYGRHLDEKDTLYSLISRQSIDTLKEFYRSDVSNDEWLLIKKLKSLFDVP